jgi:hypothetical protein
MTIYILFKCRWYIRKMNSVERNFIPQVLHTQCEYINERAGEVYKIAKNALDSASSPIQSTAFHTCSSFGRTHIPWKLIISEVSDSGGGFNFRRLIDYFSPTDFGCWLTDMTIIAVNMTPAQHFYCTHNNYVGVVASVTRRTRTHWCPSSGHSLPPPPPPTHAPVKALRGVRGRDSHTL